MKFKNKFLLWAYNTFLLKLEAKILFSIKNEIANAVNKAFAKNSTETESYELLTLDEVLAITKCSKTKFHNLMYEKHYPSPIEKLPGERQSLWLKSEIINAQKKRISGRKP